MNKLKALPLLSLIGICLYTINYMNHESTINIKHFKSEYIQRQLTPLSLEQISSPCMNRIDWVKRLRDRKNLTYAPNTVVKLEKISKNETYKIELYTYDKIGKNKTFGGDSWLVKIKSDITSFSIDLSDNLDGSYTSYFSLPQAGTYGVYIILEYSLCEGLLDPPLDFFKTGTFQGAFHKQKLGEVKHLLHIKLPTKYIDVKTSSSEFYGCNYKLPVECKHMNSKFGYWYNSTFKDCSQIDPDKEARNNPTVFKKLDNKIKNKNKSLDTLLIYGDSLSMYFYHSIKKKDICKDLFKTCKNVHTWIYARGRYPQDQTQYMTNIIYDDKDFNETIFFDGITHALKDLSLHSNKSVVLINFGLHIIKCLQYERMKNLFIQFLDYIDEFKRTLGTSAPLFIWKSVTQPGQANNYYDDIRFMTTQRAHIWNEFTIQEGCKRNLSFLHIYELSSSHPHGTRDQSHYKNSAFFPAENALYRYLQSYDFD